MKRSALVLALALCACNPNKTALDANFHPTERNWGSLQPVWSDEFNTPGVNPPNSNNWVLGQFCGGHNGEQQCYTALPQNAVVAQGVLTITAMPDSCTGSTIGQAEPQNWVGPTATTCTGGVSKFSSAFLHTKVPVAPGPHAWRYRRIEIRAKLPYGTGTWPAFWMMPLDGSKYQYWPGAGEIDFMETANLRTDLQPVDWVQTNIHVCSSNNQVWEQNPGVAAVNGCQSYSTLTTNPGDPTAANPSDPNAFHKANSEKKLVLTSINGCPQDLVDQFHTYALEWSDWDMRFYVDDQLIQQLNYVLINPQPFQEPFYLIVNLAVGGGMTGFSDPITDPVPNPPTDWLDSATQPKAKLVLDWVRIYECVPDPSARQCIFQGQGLGRKPPPISTQAICLPEDEQAFRKKPTGRRQAAR